MSYVAAPAQEKQVEERIPVNQLDVQGKRNGKWWISQPAVKGDPAVTEFGSYDHGRRYGVWYKLDENGDLLSIETYRNDWLDGEAKYFEKGALYCVGHYRGLNTNQRYDTIVVMNPITHDEYYKAIETDRGSVRHGIWRYFDPLSGYLVKEEEYQVDELIYKKEFEISPKSDSTYRQSHIQNLPHNKGSRYQPPASKQYSYTR